MDTSLFSGDRSSVGRAPDCDSGCRGFDPHRSPHFYPIPNLFPLVMSGPELEGLLGSLKFSRDLRKK